MERWISQPHSTKSHLTLTNTPSTPADIDKIQRSKKLGHCCIYVFIWPGYTCETSFHDWHWKKNPSIFFKYRIFHERVSYTILWTTKIFGFCLLFPTRVPIGYISIKSNFCSLNNLARFSLNLIFQGFLDKKKSIYHLFPRVLNTLIVTLRDTLVHHTGSPLVTLTWCKITNKLNVYQMSPTAF